MRNDGVNFIRTFFNRKNEKAISPDALIKILRYLPGGVSELMCHPAKHTNDLSSSYKEQREVELMSLTSDKVRDTIKELSIRLINWNKAGNV